MSINGCIDEQNVVFPYNAILFILKREENSYTLHGWTWRYYTKWNKPDTKKIDCVIPLIWVTWNSTSFIEYYE